MDSRLSLTFITLCSSSFLMGFPINQESTETIAAPTNIRGKLNFEEIPQLVSALATYYKKKKQQQSYPRSPKSDLSSFDSFFDLSSLEAPLDAVESYAVSVVSNVSDPLQEGFKTGANVLESQAETAYTSTMSGLESVYNSTSGAVATLEVQAENGALNIYNSSSTTLQSTAISVSTKLENLYNKTSLGISAAYNSTYSTVSGVANSTGNFFSNSWLKVTTWWTDLEDTVKADIHLAMKFVDVFLTAAVLILILWIIKKFRQGYRFIKRITTMPDEDEHQTV